MTDERALQILCSYLDFELDATEVGYVFDVLRDECGCSDEELKELGFGFYLEMMEEE